MGSDKSSRADSNVGTANFVVAEPMLESARGRKSIVIESEATAEDSFFVEENNNAVVSDEESLSVAETEEESESEEDSEEEEDEEWEERRLILEDAKSLKMLAFHFLHPEAPVEVHGYATARCYFDRFSAAEQETVEYDEARDLVLEDLKKMKKLVVYYHHPEMPVICEDAMLFGRNYFSRASASEKEEEAYDEERQRVFAELNQLKKLAVDYLHPELPVVCEDPTLYGRSYFSRGSAPEQENEELDEERGHVLAEAQQLKKLAVDYLHPERPVLCEDPALFGRNYFSRASFPEQESEEFDEERQCVLAEAQQLKKLAVDYLHPERPIQVDPTLFGRNYFSRSSFPEQESEEFDEERQCVLAETQQLKKLAVDFLHPERPVECEDPALFGRNYFGRGSAPEQENEEFAEERLHVLAEVQQLRKLAVDYFHPERPVVCEDPALFGRNYFSRGSAPEQETEEFDEERQLVLAQAQQLKNLAVDYLHPERPVGCEDPALFGRNYYSRASAPVQETLELDEERQRVLADCLKLKNLAIDYSHPERPVACEDPALFGRNYFSRGSAPEQEMEEFDEERQRVLAEAQHLKKLAVDYIHPERPVACEDPALFGRNYFGRASAPPQEDFSLAEERQRVLEEAQRLKAIAVDYLHPERPVACEDPALFGRNYFTRVFAPEQEAQHFDEERQRVLAEGKLLKNLAVNYLHPERPIVCEDPTLFSRNYFDRPSAPQQETEELDEERQQVLAEAQHLKKLAKDYMHPERPVACEDSALFGRNYFGRASAPLQEDLEFAEERLCVLEEAQRLKSHAVDYRHPERPVVCEDPALFGRNYFTRVSAPEQEAQQFDEERQRVLAEGKLLKNLAVNYLHPERPIVCEDPALFSRNYFDRPSAPQQETEELDEERQRVLADCLQLKKLAKDYMHPERPVACEDPTLFGRNYFRRASAHDQELFEYAAERMLVLEEAKLLKKLAVDYLHPEHPVVSEDPNATGRNYFNRASAYTHNYMIHTFPAHEDDDAHGHGEHHQLDHFNMDEDDHMFDMHGQFAAVPVLKTTNDVTDKREQEGNLSRSPSSVMLFGGEPIYE